MSRYNLDAFSPQDFQRFCVAAILARAGKTVHPFTHKGPDGGIDAFSYDGQDVYQVKHHEVSYVGMQAANKLVARDVADELRVLLDRHKLSPRTFVLVTNVRLYPATLAKIQEIANQSAPQLSVIVWDRGVLEAELDNNAALRVAWAEQAGDIVGRLSDEVERLKGVSGEVATAEATLRRFLATLPGHSSPQELSPADLKMISEGSEDALGRLETARLLRGKRGDTVLRFLLGYFMVDYSLLMTFPAVGLTQLEDSLAETVRSIWQCRTPAAALFAVGCLTRPFRNSSAEDSPDWVCLRAALNELHAIDQSWFVNELVSLYGKSRAVWLMGFLSFHLESTATESSILLTQVGRAVQRHEISSLSMPSAREVYEDIVNGAWIGDDFLPLTSDLKGNLRDTFKRHVAHLQHLDDATARVHIAVALALEEAFGLTPYDCDFNEGSKYDLLTRFVRDRILVREVVNELSAVLGVSGEEIQRRDDFSRATETASVIMLTEGLGVLDVPFDRVSRSSAAVRG